MASLSSTALNAIRGGYGGPDPDASSIYGLGAASTGTSVKQLKAQMELEQRKLDMYKSQFQAELAANLLGQGWDSKDVSSFTGMDAGRLPSDGWVGYHGINKSNSSGATARINLGRGYGTMVDTRDRTDTGRPYYTQQPYRLGTSYEDTIANQKASSAARASLIPRYQGGRYMNI